VGKYRLIVSDLDGTLRAEGSAAVTPRVRAAVAAAQARGVRVVMATGRMFRTSSPFARALGLTTPLICNQGASIHDLETEKAIWERRIPRELLDQLFAFARDQVTLAAVTAGNFYATRVDENLAGLSGNITLGHLYAWAELPHDPEKVMFINDAKTSAHLYPQLTAQFSHRLQIVRSSDHYVELTHGDASKGNAVKWLAARWNIPREEIIAMGDQDNDRSMIEWAGLGVAMGNAVESVKSIAHYIAPSAAEDGAAVVIEKFILGRG